MKDNKLPPIKKTLSYLEARRLAKKDSFSPADFGEVMGTIHQAYINGSAITEHQQAKLARLLLAHPVVLGWAENPELAEATREELERLEIIALDTDQMNEDSDDYLHGLSEDEDEHLREAEANKDENEKPSFSATARLRYLIDRQDDAEERLFHAMRSAPSAAGTAAVQAYSTAILAILALKKEGTL